MITFFAFEHLAEHLTLFSALGSPFVSRVHDPCTAVFITFVFLSGSTPQKPIISGSEFARM